MVKGTCQHCGRKVEVELTDGLPPGNPDNLLPDPHRVLKQHFNQAGFVCQGSGNIPVEDYAYVQTGF